MVALSGTATVGPEPGDAYVLGHGLTAAPYLVLGIACTWRTVQLGPPEYRGFWVRWLVATIIGAGAAAAAIASVLTDTRALLYVDMALIAAGVPVWISAVAQMSRANAGRRSASVDLVDALTALLVLGAPGVLLVAEPLAHTEKLAYALPFALAAVFVPAGVYLSIVNLVRIPRGERAAQGIGLALVGASGVNLTMQLARVLGGIELSLRAFVLVHVVNLGLFALTPLWAHRRRPGAPQTMVPSPEEMRRVNPMPYLSAAALPLLGLYAFAIHDDHPWGVWFVLVVALLVVVLNAARHTALSREADRLYSGITGMAEERRQLLARLLRGLDDDHHRTATELHSQAVGSLATLGTLAQLAHVALPTDTAQTVKETIASLQRDLVDRAEHLRQLMLAIRPPSVAARPMVADVPAGGDDTLAAALAASARELQPEDTSPTVRIEIDPGLQLDWSTTTIVYRIAQEAVLNAARHAQATQIGVAIAEEAGQVVVEVVDDGVGFDEGSPGASGLATMHLLAHVGGGELTVRSRPGEGTQVRCALGPQPGRRPERHLRIVTEADTEG
jgi:signal transduction histidine kinase